MIFNFTLGSTFPASFIRGGKGSAPNEGYSSERTVDIFDMAPKTMPKLLNAVCDLTSQISAKSSGNP